MPDITTRAQFAAVLAQTIAEIDALVQREPAYPVWRQLQRQLHVVRQWSTAAALPEAARQHPVTIGLIAARELEPAAERWMQELIDRLHALNQYWRHWPGGPPPAPRRSPPALRKAGILVGAVTAAALAVVALFAWFARIAPGPPVPLGKPLAIPGALARLTSSLEPYIVTLHRNPDRDRYSVQLLLSDPGGARPDRSIPIAHGLRAADLHLGTRLLGDDGHNLWFYANTLGAWDYRQGRLVTLDDLRRANPSLAKFPGKDNRGDPLIAPAVSQVRQPPRDLFAGEHRLYGVAGRLRITTPDFTRVFEVDPATLVARPR